MSKSEVPATPEALSGYNNYAYEPILHQEFNVLKARMLNLVESVARDENHAKSIKGLVRDFVNQAYYGSLRNLRPYLEYFKVIEDQTDGPPMSLEAGSLDELYHSGH